MNLPIFSCFGRKQLFGGTRELHIVVAIDPEGTDDYYIFISWTHQ